MPQFILLPTRRAGFTLIELIVSTAITLVMVAGGIAAFVQFNDRQTLVVAGKEVQTYVRSAQVKARAGDRPDNCDKLVGYGIRATADTSQLRLVALCEDTVNPGGCTSIGGNQFECPRATYELSPEVVFGNSITNMNFATLHGGVTNPADIVLERGTQTYTLPVTSGGEIGDPIIQ